MPLPQTFNLYDSHSKTFTIYLHLKEVQAQFKKTSFFKHWVVAFSVAKATLELQMYVCPSVRQSQKPLSLSELLLLAIEPINHRA